ncbi:MAG: TerD family protein [Deltaproteobacteria bacterium]|nr:TerD family protein [Deltaproteobacteria bacterium]
MIDLTRGQKGKVADLGGKDVVEVAINIAPRGSQVVDVSCFGLDSDGRLSDDNYFIFYNQKRSPEGAIEMQGARHGAKECFRVELNRFPEKIKRLVFAGTIDGAGTMADLGASYVELRVDGSAVARYTFSGSDFSGEKALMTFELYLKDVWRYSAVGQGFNGGLSALLKSFGGEEVAPAAAPAAPTPTPTPPPATAPAAPGAPKISLSKVTLDKKGAKSSVNLSKGGAAQQPIHVNLNWDNPNAGKRTGLFGLGGTAAAPDLDLGCMYLMKNGEKGVIQPLGERFGSRHASPFIYLDKDDRTGASADGENLYILRPDLIEMVTVFALIYEGTANFANVNGRLTMKNGSQEIFIPLNNPSAQLTFCAICQIKNQGDSVEITKEERYYSDHSECDAHFGYGFRWVAGHK